MAEATVVERVWAHVDEERLFALAFEAVRAYSPSGAEQPATEVFSAAFERAGVPCERQPVGGDGRENLIAVLGPEPIGLLFVGHVDTIRLLPGEDPSVARREGDELSGLGSADMKGGCAAIVECMAALKASGLPLARGVAAALVVGEEEYGDGSVRLKERVTAPLTIIGEPTGLLACTEHHGYLELDLVAQGRRAHAATPEVGASAIEPMLRWLLEVLEQAPRLGDDVVVSVRQLEGGSELFVVPERCEASLDVHLPVGVSPEAFEHVVEQARRRAAASSVSGVELTHQRVHWGPGYALEGGEGDREHLKALRAAFAESGLAFQPTTFRSHSDASHLRSDDGAHPVVCGPGRLEVAHARHEHVSLQEVAKAARLYAAIAWESCRGP